MSKYIRLVVLSGVIGVTLAAGVTFAAATWHGTGWITNGSTIRYDYMRDNFDYVKSQIDSLASGGSKWTSNGSRIYYNNGNVGIGTSSPGQKLEVVGNIYTNGKIMRKSHSSGFLEGSYNSVGQNSAKSNPIYTIGSSYNPTDTSLSNMYGIGYAHGNFWGSGGGKPGGWGMYVAADGDARIILDASGGIAWASGSMRSPIFYDSNNTGYYVNPNSTSRMYRIDANYYYYASDEKLKKDVETLDGLDLIKRLRGVSFKWKDNGEQSVGLIAQEVEKVLPELVNYNPDTDIKSVQYGNLVAPLIEAVKELSAKVDDQQKEIETLKDAINK